jgi:hypothetical protein
LIEEAIAEHGREAQRERKLLPPTVVWLVVGMSLFRNLSIKNVLRKLVQEVGLEVNWELAEVPCNTSTTHARDRLGWLVMKTLYYEPPRQGGVPSERRRRALSGSLGSGAQLPRGQVRPGLEQEASLSEQNG